MGYDFRTTFAVNCTAACDKIASDRRIKWPGDQKNRGKAVSYDRQFTRTAHTLDRGEVRFAMLLWDTIRFHRRGAL